MKKFKQIDDHLVDKLWSPLDVRWPNKFSGSLVSRLTFRLVGSYGGQFRYLLWDLLQARKVAKYEAV